MSAPRIFSLVLSSFVVLVPAAALAAGVVTTTALPSGCRC